MIADGLGVRRALNDVGVVVEPSFLFFQWRPDVCGLGFTAGGMIFTLIFKLRRLSSQGIDDGEDAVN